MSHVQGFVNALPESLQRQLRAFEKRLCFAETLVAAGVGISGLLVTYLLTFLSDRLWDTPVALRLGLTALGGACAAACVWFWLRHWLWRRRTPRELACLIQKTHRVLGDRLQGAIELAADPHPGESIELAEAAIRQIAGEASALDFARAAPVRPLRRTLALAGLLTGLSLLAVVLFRDAARNAFWRWAMPPSGPARYTFVRLQDTPANLVVAHGEPFEIPIALSPDSFWRPARVVARMGRQPAIEGRFERDAATLKVPGQLEPGSLRVNAGDATRHIAIAPTYRPVLKSLSARVQLPDYLHYPVVERAVANGMVESLAGSRVQLTGVVDRELEHAEIQGTPPVTLPTDGATFVTPVLDVESSPRLAITWTDRYGLQADAPLAVELAGRKDQAPYITLKNAATAIAVLEDEVVVFETYALDDYGVRDIRVAWDVEERAERGVAAMHDAAAVAEGGHEKKELSANYSFCAAAAHIPAGAIVSLCAQATDYFPDRAPAASQPCRISVLTWEEHIEYVQQMMDRLQNEIEQLARDEDDVSQATRNLRARPDEEIRRDSTRADVDEQQRAEEANRNRLAKAAQTTRDILATAMRNQRIDDSVILSLAEAGRKMSSTASGSMSEASKAMQSARDSAPQRAPKLDEAIRQQERTLQDLKDMQETLNTSIETLLAQSFVNRLRMAAQSEKEISEALQKNLDDTIGLDAEALTTNQVATRESQVVGQKETRERVKNIQDDLAGYFNRTRRSIYHDIHTNMVGKGATENLAQISDLISANKAFKGIEGSEKWAQQFNAWADALNGYQQTGEGADASSATMVSARDVDILLKLERARQREETVREHTRKAEESRPSNRNYPADSQKIARQQQELAHDVSAMERAAENEELGRMVETIAGQMLNIEVMLRRPQTDAATIAAQTEIIEMLSQSISMAQKNASGSQRSQAMMAMLGMSPNGGGNPGGGNADRTGAASGTGFEPGQGEDRSVEKAGGSLPQNVPTEFRDAIEGYYESIQK